MDETTNEDGFDRQDRRGTIVRDVPTGELSRDIGWIIVITTLVSLALMATGVVGRLIEWITDRGLTGVLVVLLVGPLAASLFAISRYRDAAGVRHELARLSMHDSLTGLPNRRFLNENFEAIVRRARRQGGRVAVCFVDLDKFKAVNDTYGHEVGDRLMVSVSRRIADQLPEDGVAIRYGGDEFVIISPTMVSPQVAERLAGRIVDVVETPFEMGEDRIQISASIGVAVTEANCNEPRDVIRDADAAMYQAKATGSGTVTVFDRDTPNRITPSTAEKRLRTALDEGQFHLVYQPVVSLKTQRMVKVEALIRWDDPERGIVSPGEFIPALEETGLIVPVGTWILEEGCRQAREWQLRYTQHAPLTVNINVSARQLAQYDFNDVLARTLACSEVDPGLICLEITEGALMSDVDAAWTVLRLAKGQGVYVALDDFGTGFSSLSFLRQFSLDIVKIDKSFVDGLGDSREDTTIIEHVIGMARGLGMATVAEGVESADQVRYLRSLGCHMAQGFFYGRPQHPDVVDRIMAQTDEKHAGWRPGHEDPPTSTAGARTVTPALRG